MLFGHDLPDRLNKGEEILFFCFDFLKYIENEHFSIHKRYDRTSKQSESETFLIDSDSFEIITNSSFSPKNSSSSSIEQNSVDGDSSPAVVFTDSVDNQDDSRNNVYVLFNYLFSLLQHFHINVHLLYISTFITSLYML